MSSGLALEAEGGRWKRYLAYRDSGVGWLGAVPEGWEVNKLSRFAEIKGRIGWRGYTVSDLREKDDGVLVIGATQIDVNGNIDLSKPTYLSYEKYEESPEIKLNGSELLLVKVGATIGKIGYVPNDFEKATVNPNVMIVRNSNLNQKFLFYFLRSPYIHIEMDVSKSAGAQDAINQDFVGSLMIAYPTSPEQHAIAAFLDRETGRIDALIAKKERQIELLREKRAALISHAVTKGLDPAAPMKDSGVEWLEAMPEGWGVKRLKYLASESLKYGANESAELDDPDLPRYIRITDIAEDGSLRVDTFKSLPEDVARPYLLQSGDILFARSGATVGKSFIYHESRGRACYAGYLIRLRVNSRVAAPAFLSYFASSSAYWDWASSIFIQATIQNISAEKYANLSVAIPPLPEQHAIAAFLDRETGRIDTLTAKVRESISKLREYRTALISAAVTGKIDVREELVS